MQTDVFQLDKRQMRLAFDRAADSYDTVAILQREVANRVLERLDYIKTSPQRILDIGAGTGFCTRNLAQRYPQARLEALDISHAMLKYARGRSSLWQRWRKRIGYTSGDAEQLPYADASIDMVFSNLTLQWCWNMDTVFGEFRRVLKPGGLLMFTTFGPDTLKELRSAWSAADAFVHVNGFLDMHDIGDALIRGGFADPVMDAEHLTVTYGDVRQLMRDLKKLGAHNVTAGRPRGLTGKQRLLSMQQAYEKFRDNGVLPATHEIVYGHAWVSEEQQPQRQTPQSVNISVTSIK